MAAKGKPKPEGHRLHPHEHYRLDTDGKAWKPCSGRFWCTSCKDWHSGKQCDLPGAPAIPAGWLKG